MDCNGGVCNVNADRVDLVGWLGGRGVTEACEFANAACDVVAWDCGKDAWAKAISLLMWMRMAVSLACARSRFRIAAS